MTFFLSIVTSSFTRRLLPVAVFVALIAVFREPLLRSLGVGIVLPIVVSAILVWTAWGRGFPSLLSRWNTWLAAIAFSAALLGILAFFEPGGDTFFQKVSLGGNWGKLVITSSTATGVVIVLVALLAGTAFLGPRTSWRLARTAAPKIVPALRRLKEWGQSAAVGISEFYREHPLHETILRRKKKPIGLPVRDISYPPPQRTFEPTTEAPEGIQPSAASTAVPPPTTTPKLEPSPVVMAFPGQWYLPSVELLDETPPPDLSQLEVEKRARAIEEALASYGVEAKVIQINVGPAVTQFGVEPGWDRRVKDIKEKDKSGNIKVRTEEVSRMRVKVERISSLSNDLALALAAPSVRIEAPIPGTSLVGIEVPNSSMETVSAREVIESPAFKKLGARTKLAIAVGKGTGGDEIVRDLAKMPHLLIAGATGSGKTVCLDSTIASLLTNTTPEELRLIMIDPKRVELIAFNGTPHLLTPVITENDKAVEMLEWLSKEMDNRYRSLAQAGAHNIERYNRSTKIPKEMPYLIVIIDELADLMMAKADEVEPRLCRLAQMGRAVGIHLVVATQRPSVDVITGLIKANFPTRISFAVVSQVDSRTILDMTGAEKLLGKGDMLFLAADAPKPIRVQGCFVSQDEIDRLVRAWKEQARLQPAPALDLAAGEGSGSDPLLAQARQLKKTHKQISSSFLQRQLRVGYARAEKLMELLDKEETDGSSDTF
ncbi:MAG: DNA translocase FtsK [Chloroflexi bacterium]|nr:DNA translocase FtsK [Chloroflexota bacterium]